jgi:hypothetical protein
MADRVGSEANPLAAVAVKYLGFEHGVNTATWANVAVLYLSAMPEDVTVAFSLDYDDAVDMLSALWEMLGVGAAVERGPCFLCGELFCDCDTEDEGEDE